MNRILIAGAAAIFLATSASAGDQPITVTARPSFSDWMASTSQILTDALKRTDLARAETGITYVRFTQDEAGKPQGVSTVKSGSFKPNLDRAGRAVARRMRALPPLFNGARPDTTIEAAIVVANDRHQLERLTAEVADRARRQNVTWAARQSANPVVLLAVVGRI